MCLSLIFHQWTSKDAQHVGLGNNQWGPPIGKDSVGGGQGRRVAPRP